jgi:hypothetical protein
MSKPDPVCRHEPKAKYFQQFELGPAPNNYPYEYTRYFTISAQSFDSGTLNDLRIVQKEIAGTADLGVPRDDQEWRGVLAQHLGASGLRQGTELDIAVRHRSRIILELVGQFWRFPAGLGAVTTKRPHADQYFDLLRHVPGAAGPVDVPEAMPCTCVSFFTGAPCQKSQNIRHGFSINVELQSGNGWLPLTIDPDIPNQGGTGPTPPPAEPVVPGTAA